MSHNLVLDILTNEVKKIYNLKPNVWMDDQMTENDMTILKKEANEMGSFDKFNLKKEMYDAFINKQADVIVKKINNARVVIIRNDKEQTFPWKTWSRLFQWLGNPEKGSMWQIYIYASPKERILPTQNETVVGPEHVNGGYTHACSHECVVVYRYEESTRVLIHELLHASCSDDPIKNVEEKEAATESWAELFLVSLLSKGNKHKADELWKEQDNYIQDLNYTLRNFHNVNNKTDYAARYTIMREDVFKLFRIHLDANYTPKQIHISRFTSPKLDQYLEQ